MSSALEGIRIIDLSRGPAVGLATMILADFGAEVVAINYQTDDPFEQLPAAPMWRRGKHQLTLDLPSKREELRQLCASADVLVTSLSTRSLEHLEIDLTELREAFPTLVTCQVSGFGHLGPKSNLPGYEHLVAAATGRMMTFQGLTERPGPVFSALQVGIHATAQSTATGILAALWQRQTSGAGSAVNTSLLQGMLPYEQGAMVARQFPDRFAGLLPQKISAEAPLPTLFYHPAQTGDGSWMQFGNLLPHLFDNYLMVTELLDVLADPDFDAKQLRLPEEKNEAFRERMLARIQELSADEWMTRCIENGGVVAGKYQSTQAAMLEPDIIENGHVINVDGTQQLGPLARMLKTPAQPGRPTATAELLATWASSPRDQITQAHAPEPPLKGVRVLELATIIAAPLGASFLADLGAEVTKVEQIGGDPYRGFSFGAGSARVNAGKRSISLNLKSETGQAIVAKLAAEADVLIHNYRPGVPEKLGFGYAEMQALNPGLIYLQCNGYGPDGPGAHRPCTHPIPGAAMGGVMYQMGERVPIDLQDFASLKKWTARLMRANEVNPDPNTALVIATSALIGLTARAKHGEGQKVLVDMFGANAYANHDDFIAYPNKQDRALPDEALCGLGACYRLYPCADDQWLFLAVPQKHEQLRFIASLNGLGFTDLSESIFDTPEDELVKTLSSLFITQTADYWETELSVNGLGVVRADRYDPAEYWLLDPQAAAMGLTTRAQHPVWGEYQRHAANVTANETMPPLAAAPLGGQHSREIMAELGYSEAEIDAAFAAGAAWSEVETA